jgi:hypothetical protein
MFYRSVRLEANGLMGAGYLTNESGEPIGVVLDVAEYERLRRSVEEVARTERHPGKAFRGSKYSRRAWVPGSGFDVWEIVAGYGKWAASESLKSPACPKTAFPLI